MVSGRVARTGIAIGVFALIAYAAASAVVWHRLTTVGGDCPPAFAGNDPTAFRVPGGPTSDAVAQAMPVPETVELPSRDPAITVAGWWLPAAEPDAPAVVVVHGHTSCRRDHTVLLPAGMLHRNGFSVLLIDLRDHGDSTLEDGRYAGGTEEYRDVLGAWDWLREAKGVPEARIGVLGISLGAATALIAAGEEPRVAAVWEDSSYADIGTAIRAELARNGYPTFLEAGGVAVARILSGDDLASRSPLEAVRQLGGRSLFVTHGTNDRRLDASYGEHLLAAAVEAGVRVDSWIVEGAEHVEAMLLHPADYEARLVRFFGDALAG